MHHFLHLPGSYILAHYLSSSEFSDGSFGAITLGNALIIQVGNVLVAYREPTIDGPYKA
jgi:hypothetical protein